MTQQQEADLLPDREPVQQLERRNAGPALPAADPAQVQLVAGQQAELLGVLLEEQVERAAARRKRAVLQDARRLDVHLLGALPQDAQHPDVAQVQPVALPAALARLAAQDVRQVPALQLSARDVADFRPADSALSEALA